MVATKLESGQKNFTVEKCYEKADKFRFDLSIQRNQVWKKEKKSLFIHSMLIGYPLADIYTMGQENDSFYWVLDGKQRLTTFFDFIDGKFTLEGDDIEPIDGVEIKGKTFAELPLSLQYDLMQTKVTIVHFKNLDREQRDRLFYRLNNGEPLSKMEQTRALSGEFMDKVVDVVKTDLFKNKLRMTEKTRARFKDIETVLQTMLFLDKCDSVEGLGSSHIRDFVKSNQEFDNAEEVFNRLYKTISYIEAGTVDYGKKELKIFKKANMPVIVRVAEIAKDKDVEAEKFGEYLARFFREGIEKDGEYATLLKAGSSKKENVLRRSEILERYIQKQVMKGEVLNSNESSGEMVS